MLPRRFALIRHVDYTGGAGTGVIAYGVAFDDGQVVLRWSSAHRATSVLDSVEDLVAAHGHGETTSIEWIDAPPGTSDTPAPTGRRARRSTSPADEQPAADDPQVTSPPADARPASQAREPAGPAHARRAARAPQAPAARADSGDTNSPTPTTADTTPAHPAVPAQPATPAQPAAPAQPAIPEAAQPASPAPEQPAANTPAWEPAQGAGDSSTQPNVAASLGVSRLPQQAPSGNEPAPDTSTPAAAKPAAHASPASNGAAHATQPAQAPFSRTASATPGDERRSRHAAIATQPMKADFADEPEPRRAKRTPAHESPRSIFEEAEEPPRPDLRLASSNGRAPEPEDTGDAGSEPAQREAFDGFFSTGHQHLETVTGLLDLPAGLDKRGRAAEAEQDAIASRRNGRHRGE